MQYLVKLSEPEKEKTQCLILGVYEGNVLTNAAKKIDARSQGYISQILKHQDFFGKLEQTMWLPHIPHIDAERILLIGCGKKNEMHEFNFNKLLASAFSFLKNTRVTEVTSYLTNIKVPKQSLAWQLKQTVLQANHQYYFFDRFKTKTSFPKPALKKLSLITDTSEEIATLEKAVHEAEAMSLGIQLAKDLGNLPSNICTPSYLAQEAQKLTKSNKKLKVSVLEEKDMKKLGMEALLAVSSGSEEPAKLIVIKYQGAARNKAPIALVGKGITFDSGGLSLKPAASMFEMKYDMMGAASVLGVFKAISFLQLPINLIGVIPASENLPSGKAVKPGDIIKTMSLQTVEILNTDAEGRLVLCDALTYCEQFNPEIIIDIATLTGAVLIALGTHASGLFSNNEQLADQIIKAGQESYDRVWPLPLWDEYQSEIDSGFADMSNISRNRIAGSVIGACFLSRFTKKFRWAHLDIAGTAFTEGNDAHATGRPIPLLVQFLLDYQDKVH